MTPDRSEARRRLLLWIAEDLRNDTGAAWTLSTDGSHLIADDDGIRYRWQLADPPLGRPQGTISGEAGPVALTLAIGPGSYPSAGAAFRALRRLIPGIIEDAHQRTAAALGYGRRKARST